MVLGCMIFFAVVIGGGWFGYQAYKSHQQQEALDTAIRSCSTCDARKEIQIRSRNSRAEQSAIETTDGQKTAQ